MHPRDFFANLPDEAFNTWLTPLIAELGWPFNALDDNIAGTKWQALLGNVPLRTWHEYSWELRGIELTPVALAHSSLMKINGIVDHCERGAHTVTANVQNTKARFRACAEYVSVNGRIPVPIVAIPRHGRLELVDGHHRVAAVFHCGIASSYKPLAYVASLGSKG